MQLKKMFLKVFMSLVIMEKKKITWNIAVIPNGY